MTALDIPEDGTVTDDFATIPGVSVATATNRVLPRQVTTGVTRGTQTIQNTDGSYVTLGLIPDGGTDFGIAFFNSSGVIISKNTGAVETIYDSSGNMISQNTGETQFIYDGNTGKNVMQIGKLPDDTYGFAVAATGDNVADGYS